MNPHENNNFSSIPDENIRRQIMFEFADDSEVSNHSAASNSVVVTGGNARSITPTPFVPPLPSLQHDTHNTNKRARVSESTNAGPKPIPAVLISESKSIPDGELIMSVFLTRCRDEGYDNSLKHGKLTKFVEKFCSVVFMSGFPLAIFKKDSISTFQKKLSSGLSIIKNHHHPCHSSSDSANGETIPAHLTILIDLFDECYSNRMIGASTSSQASTNLTVSRQVMESMPNAIGGSTDRVATRAENSRAGCDVIAMDGGRNKTGNAQPTKKLSILPIQDVLNSHHSSFMSMMSNFNASRGLNRRVENLEKKVNDWQKSLLDATRNNDQQSLGLINGFLERDQEELNKLRAKLDELVDK
jgi:hypothetical protein